MPHKANVWGILLQFLLSLNLDSWPLPLLHCCVLHDDADPLDHAMVSIVNTQI